MAQAALAKNPLHSSLSPIRETFKRVKDDPEIANLCIGDPSCAPPPAALQAMARALTEGKTHYENDAGNPLLRRALCERENALRGTSLRPYDNVVITNGGTNGIYSISRSVLDPGDEVLLPEPIWIPFIQITRLLNCTPVMVPTRFERGFVPDVADLERQLTSRTKMLVVVSPGNPTGAVYDPRSMADLLAFCERHDLWLLHDEAYRDIVFGDALQASVVGQSDVAIGVGTLSKSHAMTGLRVGWVLSSNEALISRVRLNVAYNVMCCSTPAQIGAIAALTEEPDYLAGWLSTYEKRMSIASERLRIMGFDLHRPNGSFYLFPRHRFGPSLAVRLLEEARVAVVDGQHFGPSGRDHVRISCAGPDEVLRQGLDRIEVWCRDS